MQLGNNKPYQYFHSVICADLLNSIRIKILFLFHHFDIKNCLIFGLITLAKKGLIVNRE